MVTEYEYVGEAVSAAEQGGTVHRLGVLIVEDNPDTAESLARLLHLFGHDVRTARTGADALRAVADREPDVVLLDVGLPGMDGYQVARRLKEMKGVKQPLLIALTGHAGEDARRRSAAAGIDLHLSKPAEPEYLRRLLSSFQRVITAD